MYISLMEIHFDHLLATRRHLIGATEDLSPESLQHVPPGFRNNLVWNMGHLTAIQRSIAAVLAGHA